MTAIASGPLAMSDRHASVLPHYLALLYGLAIVYASLQPFGPWMAPPTGTPFFLFAPGPARYTRFDVLANAVAYVPFAMLVALVPRVMYPWGRFSLALVTSFALSFAMESLQMALPPRDASVVDLVSNTVGGALGAGIGVAFATSPAAKQAVTAARHRWFLGGKFG